VDLGVARDDDTREDETFYKKITEVREALRGAELGDTARGVDDR
jgi:NitT/TauT family transport system ATP-binding protein